MNRLQKISEMNINITWLFIEIGYKGYKNIEPIINKQEVYEYAYSVLENTDKDFEDIALLLSAKSDDYEFNQILNKLVKLENSDFELQVRKWVVYLTQNMISNIERDYLEGLLTMTGFWILLGEPKDCPHIFQGVGNNITQEDYYTEEMYNLLINKHKEWIKKEIKQIRDLEKTGK